MTRRLVTPEDENHLCFQGKPHAWGRAQQSMKMGGGRHEHYVN